jgi:hypothetical protein
MQQFLTVRSQFDKYFPTILVIVPTYYRPLLHESINKFYRTVMAQTEPFRKRPDGGRLSSGNHFMARRTWCCCGSIPLDRAASSLKCRNWRIR